VASRASYVVLRSSQRRASHHGVPVLVYGAGKHGVAAIQELFDDPASGLKPIGFVDDDPQKTGRLVNGLPVVGRSYDLEVLVTSLGIKAVVIAAPAISADCHARIVNASGRVGIGLFRMRVQLEQLVESAVDVITSESVAAPATAPASVVAA